MCQSFGTVHNPCWFKLAPKAWAHVCDRASLFVDADIFMTRSRKPRICIAKWIRVGTGRHHLVGDAWAQADTIGRRTCRSKHTNNNGIANLQKETGYAQNVGNLWSGRKKAFQAPFGTIPGTFFMDQQKMLKNYIFSLVGQWALICTLKENLAALPSIHLCLTTTIWAQDKQLQHPN